MVEATQNQGAAPAEGTQQPNTPGKEGASQNQSGAGEEQKMVPITAVHEERDKRQALQGELDGMKSQLAQVQQQQALAQMQQAQQVQPNYGQQQQQQQQPDPMAQLNEMWETDPRRAADTQIMAAMQWRDQVDVGLEQQIADVSSKHADYAQYGAQVRQFLNTVPLQNRANPGIAEMAYLVIKGQNAGQNTQQAVANAQAQVNAAQQAAGLGAGTVSGAPAKGNEPTPEQIAAANAMGQPIDEYMKYVR